MLRAAPSTEYARQYAAGDYEVRCCSDAGQPCVDKIDQGAAAGGAPLG